MTYRRTLSSFALAGALLCTAASAQIGTIYCAGAANSTGSPSVMTATGSTDVAQNDVTLTVTNLPTNQFGLFITSLTPANVPNAGGSNGTLCIGGNFGRFNSNLVNSGSTGSVDIDLDLTSIPNSTMLFAVMPGETHHFQLWHRDTAAPGFSNFSPGVEITFDSNQALSFQTDIYPMLTQPNINAASCVTCHGGLCGMDIGNDAMTAFNVLVNGPSNFCCPNETYVIPGDSANSLLYQKLTVPNCGGPMPQGGTFAGDADMVRDWIDAGAPF